MKEKSIQVEERKASWKLSLKRLNWIALRQWRLLFSNSKRQHPSYLLEWCRRRRRRGTQRGFNCVALMNKMAAIILSLPLSPSLSLSLALSLSLISFSSMQALWTIHPCRSVSTMPSRRYNQDLSVSQCRLEITVPLLQWKNELITIVFALLP